MVEMFARRLPSKRAMAGVREELLQCDWVTRHERLADWRGRNFAAYCRLLTMLAPDEALNGIAEGLPPTFLFGVMVPCAPADTKRQLTLEESFERVARRRA